MRDQEWDISWKLGNTAGNGGVVSGGTIVFRPHLSQPCLFMAYQSCLIGNFTYINMEGQCARSFRAKVDLTPVKNRLFGWIRTNIRGETK
jgi:hypothetical protein